MITTGLVAETCFPYTSGATNTVPACPTSCPATGTAMATQTRYKAKSYYTITAANIQNEIMTKGPVDAAFSVYRDFYSYSTGVYTYQSGEYLGGQYVVCLY